MKWTPASVLGYRALSARALATYRGSGLGWASCAARGTMPAPSRVSAGTRSRRNSAVVMIQSPGSVAPYDARSDSDSTIHPITGGVRRVRSAGIRLRHPLKIDIPPSRVGGEQLHANALAHVHSSLPADYPAFRGGR